MLNRERRRKTELKEYKICLELPNLIYTTNTEGREEKKKGKKEMEREKMLIGYSWACLAHDERAGGHRTRGRRVQCEL